MARKKNDVVGKVVRIHGNRALEYEQRADGSQSLVGVRPLLDSQVQVPDLVSLKAMDVIAFNSEAERAFVALLSAMCDASGAAGVSVRVVRAEAAFKLGVSTETVKRYIEKWCVAPSAPFEVRGGQIFRKEGKHE